LITPETRIGESVIRRVRMMTTATSSPLARRSDVFSCVDSALLCVAPLTLDDSHLHLNV